ncbi:MAG TPA: AraC family transcriptional regulator [Planctomycetota bacterium]|nr:AraC family transcriptional regulator [Planctomycetota bacterium]
MPKSVEGRAFYWEEPQRPFIGLPEITHCKRLRTTRAAMMPWHRHRFLELCLIERGSVRWWVRGKAVDLQGGDVFLIRPHEPHGSFERPHEPCSYISIGLRTHRIRGTSLQLPPGEARLLMKVVSHAPRHLPAVQGVVALFRRAVELVHLSRDPIRVTEMRCVATAILIAIARAAKRAGALQRSTVVEEAAAVMDQHLQRPLPLPEIARKLGWSISHLKASFRREMGLPPAEYYLRRRITAAASALKAGSPVTAAALDFGFSSSQYFATAFKRITGRTPRDYRK